VTLYGIDDLRRVTDETAERRRQEIPRVESIAAEEARKVFARLSAGAQYRRRLEVRVPSQRTLAGAC